MTLEDKIRHDRMVMEFAAIQAKDYLDDLKAKKLAIKNNIAAVKAANKQKRLEMLG